MRFTWALQHNTDRNPTASITNNPPAGCRPSNHWVLSCKQQIIVLSKVCNINNTNVLEHKIAVFSLVAIAHLQLQGFLSLPQVTRGMNPLSSINTPSWSH
jgi:hypothetical protein